MNSRSANRHNNLIRSFTNSYKRHILVSWQKFLWNAVFWTTFWSFRSNLREADGDDDIIFEDFARLRLKGETEAWPCSADTLTRIDQVTLTPPCRTQDGSCTISPMMPMVAMSQQQTWTTLVFDDVTVCCCGTIATLERKVSITGSHRFGIF